MTTDTLVSNIEEIQFINAAGNSMNVTLDSKLAGLKYITGAAGVDNISVAGIGNLIINAGDGNDSVTAYAGQTANGEAGNDTIYAAYNATLTGGLGNDTFVIGRLPNPNYTGEVGIDLSIDGGVDSNIPNNVIRLIDGNSNGYGLKNAADTSAFGGAQMTVSHIQSLVLTGGAQSSSITFSINTGISTVTGLGSTGQEIFTLSQGVTPFTDNESQDVNGAGKWNFSSQNGVEVLKYWDEPAGHAATITFTGGANHVALVLGTGNINLL